MPAVHENSDKAQLLTECVEDISDENKLAGVELDHRGVRQELCTLEHRSQISIEDKVGYWRGVSVSHYCWTTWMTIFRALTFWSAAQASFRDWFNSSMRLA